MTEMLLDMGQLDQRMRVLSLRVGDLRGLLFLLFRHACQSNRFEPTMANLSHHARTRTETAVLCGNMQMPCHAVHCVTGHHVSWRLIFRVHGTVPITPRGTADIQILSPVGNHPDAVQSSSSSGS